MRRYIIEIPTSNPYPDRVDAEVLRALRERFGEVRVWQSGVEVRRTDPWKDGTENGS